MSKTDPDKIQALLSGHNVGFDANEIPHGRQFRFGDGAILNVYTSGKCVWQGKETSVSARVKQILDEGSPKVDAPAKGESSNTSTNKVFIVYGHDVEAREQLELLLRRMKLEPVILQNLVGGGQTIIEKLEGSLD